MSGGETVRISGNGAVLIGPEGRTPPLPFITVDAKEARALIGMNLAVLVEGDLPEPEVTDADMDLEPEVTEPETAPEPAPEPEVQPEPETAPEPEANPEPNAPEGGEGGTEGETREEALIAALDLMEADDLVKTGDRAGKPKVGAMEAATGLTDLTADEIDAAVAAKEAAEA